MTAPDWWTKSLTETVYGVRMTSPGDRWDAPGIKAAIKAMEGKVAPVDLAVAFIRGAANPKIRTPAGVSEPGPHWGETDHVPKVRAKPCPEHPDQKQTSCTKCERVGTPPPQDFKARIREAAETARIEREQERQGAIQP